MLDFDQSRHIYTIDGKRIPAVSDIMKPLTAPFMEACPPDKLEKARIRGTGVHEAIEIYHFFQIISEEYKNYVEQFILFLHQNDLHVHWCEKRLTNGIYAGTVDLVLKTLKNEFLLVDIKTTYKISSYVGVQLSAYKELLSYNGISVSKCYVLHLKENKHTFKEIKPDDEKWKELLSEYQNQKNEYSDKDKTDCI